MPSDIAFYLVDNGLEVRAPAGRLPDTQFARAVNVAITNRLVTTRFGARVIPLAGEAVEAFQRGNVQGALYYNPAAGQGAVHFGKESARLMVACEGRKYAIELDGRGLLTGATVSDVTNGLVSDANLHLVYWAQWENYVLAQDGTGNCWIWDGEKPAIHSEGYNTISKELSRVPNGGTAMTYVHGRGSVVVNGRAILTGDNLNAKSLISSEDVLAFREQVYWATGQYFAPPAWMGAINATAVLPLQDTQHGHGELMVHCSEGIFSVDLNIFPRTKWPETPMVRTAYRGPGATGPYAICLREGDQVFRATDGVKTLRSAKAEASLIGSPTMPISEPAGDFFTADSARWLRFATIETWHDQRRIFVSCYPMVSGRFRWHRGLVSANFAPAPGSPLAWESLITLPPQSAGIIQQLNGKWDGEERHFVLCRGNDGKNRLVEFRKDLKCDVLEDGTEHRIRSQIITRRIDIGQPFTKKNFESGTLYLVNPEGRVDFGVWFRLQGEERWSHWQSGSIENSPPNDGELGGDAMPREVAIPLGHLPDKCGANPSRHVQFLIRWAGYCSVECLKIDVNGGDPDDGRFDSRRLQLKFCERGPADYDDYEYSENSEADSWLHLPKH